MTNRLRERSARCRLHGFAACGLLLLHQWATRAAISTTTADPAAIVSAGDPVAPDGASAIPADSVAPSPSTSGAGSVSLAGFDLPGTGPAGLAGLASLGLLSLISLGVTLMVRRERARRAFSGRVSSRLATIAGPRPLAPVPATATAPSVAEVDPRSADSA